LDNDPFVAIILVNWNNWEDCVECIDTLLAQNYRKCRIFIVDNASQDESLKNIADWCHTPIPRATWRRHDGVERWTSRVPLQTISCSNFGASDCSPSAQIDAICVTLIESNTNLGFAGGCNLGIQAALAATFEFVWLLNTDTVVHRDALGALIARARRDPGIGMVGSTIRYYDDPQTIQAMGGGRLDPARAAARHIGEGLSLEHLPKSGECVEHDLSFVFGASMLVSRSLIETVGLMAEDYFLYYEELDWAMRSSAHFRLGYAPDSHVFHKSGRSSSKVLPIYAATLYYRNRVRFISRFFPQFLGAAKRSLIVEFFRATLKGRWGHARMLIQLFWNADAIASEVRPPPGHKPDA
jgi:GT2 family glycosyltransferase